MHQTTSGKSTRSNKATHPSRENVPAAVNTFSHFPRNANGHANSSSLPSTQSPRRVPPAREGGGSDGDVASEAKSNGSTSRKRVWASKPKSTTVRRGEDAAKSSPSSSPSGAGALNEAPQVASLDKFVAIPSYVKFDGFTPGEVYEMKVSLKNQSNAMQRVRILPFESQHFSLVAPSNALSTFRVAPGLAVEVTLQFRPDVEGCNMEAHDMSRRATRTTSNSTFRESEHGEAASGTAALAGNHATVTPIMEYRMEIIATTDDDDEQCVIPVRACRTRGELVLPQQVSAGECAVRGTRSATVLLRNDGNEEVRWSGWTTQSGVFAISPEYGVVPPNGSMTQIEVLFTPQVAQKYEAELIFGLRNPDDHGVVYQVQKAKANASLQAKSAGDGVAGPATFSPEDADAYLPCQSIPLSGTGVETDVVLDGDGVIFPDTFITLEKHGVVTLVNNSMYTVKFCWKSDRSQEEELSAVGTIVEVVEPDIQEAAALAAGTEGTKEHRSRLENATRGAILHRKRLFDDEAFSISPAEGVLYSKGRREFTVSFTPQLAIEYLTTAFLEVDGRFQRIPFRLQGTGLGPQCALQYKTLDVGDVIVNAENRWEVLLENYGCIDAQFTILPSTTPVGSQFTITPSTGSLVPGECVTLAVVLSSEIMGVIAETFHVHITGSPDDLLMTMKGRITGPTFHFDLPELDFGVVSYNLLHVQNVNLVNTSDVPIHYHLHVDELTANRRRRSKLYGTPKASSYASGIDSERESHTGSGAFSVIEGGSPWKAVAKTGGGGGGGGGVGDEESSDSDDEKNEFFVSPSSGILAPHDTQPIEVRFLSNTVQEYNTNLTIDIDGVGERLDAIAIRATCLVAELCVEPRLIDFGPRCYLGHPYTVHLDLRNDTVLTAKYEFLFAKSKGTMNQEANDSKKLYAIAASVTSQSSSMFSSQHEQGASFQQDDELSGALDRGSSNSRAILFSDTASPPMTVIVDDGSEEAMHGIIAPRSTVRVPVRMIANACGSLSRTIYVATIGSNKAPTSVKLQAEVRGPDVEVNTTLVAFGSLSVLQESRKSIVLTNTSPISATVTAILVHAQSTSKKKQAKSTKEVSTTGANSEDDDALHKGTLAETAASMIHTEPFRLSTYTEIIPPQGSATLDIIACLDGASKYNSELRICVENSSQTVSVPITATGVGYPLVPSIPLQRVDFGDVFTTIPLSKVFTLVNRGRTPLDVQWQNTRGSRAKEGEQPIVFRITPERAALAPKVPVTFTLTGQCDDIGVVEEAFLLKQAGVIKEIWTSQVSAHFISPALFCSVRSLSFSYIYNPSTLNAEQITTKAITIRNQQPKRLDVALKTRTVGSGFSPFTAHPETFSLESGENIVVSVTFDGTYRGDRLSHDVTSKLLIAAIGHTHTETISLSASVVYPNISISKNLVDCGVVLRDTERRETITLSNTSAVPVTYAWKFQVDEEEESGSSEVREKRDVENARHSTADGGGAAKRSGGTSTADGTDRLRRVGSKRKGEDGGSPTSASLRPTSADPGSSGEAAAAPGGGKTPPPPMRSTSPNKRGASAKKTKILVPDDLTALDARISPINQVFDILPFQGYIPPHSTEEVTVVFTGRDSVPRRVVALCCIEGGPSYPVELLGKSGEVSFAVSSDILSFEPQPYEKWATKYITLTNTDHVPAPFTVNLSTLTIPNRVVVSPMTGVIDTKVTLAVQFRPCVPDIVEESFYIHVAHLNPYQITVRGVGTYRSLVLVQPTLKSARPSSPTSKSAKDMRTSLSLRAGASLGDASPPSAAAAPAAAAAAGNASETTRSPTCGCVKPKPYLQRQEKSGFGTYQSDFFHRDRNGLLDTLRCYRETIQTARTDEGLKAAAGLLNPEETLDAKDDDDGTITRRREENDWIVMEAERLSFRDAVLATAAVERERRREEAAKGNGQSGPAEGGADGGRSPTPSTRPDDLSSSAQGEYPETEIDEELDDASLKSSTPRPQQQQQQQQVNSPAAEKAQSLPVGYTSRSERLQEKKTHSTGKAQDAKGERSLPREEKWAPITRDAAHVLQSAPLQKSRRGPPQSPAQASSPSFVTVTSGNGATAVSARKAVLAHYTLDMGNLIPGEKKKRVVQALNTCSTDLFISIPKSDTDGTPIRVNPEKAQRIRPGTDLKVEILVDTELLKRAALAPSKAATPSLGSSLKSFSKEQDYGDSLGKHSYRLVVEIREGPVVLVDVNFCLYCPSLNVNSSTLAFGDVFMGHVRRLYLELHNPQPIPCSWTLSFVSAPPLPASPLIKNASAPRPSQSGVAAPTTPNTTTTVKVESPSSSPSRTPGDESERTLHGSSLGSAQQRLGDSNRFSMANRHSVVSGSRPSPVNAGYFTCEATRGALNPDERSVIEVWFVPLSSGIARSRMRFSVKNGSAPVNVLCTGTCRVVDVAITPSSLTMPPSLPRQVIQQSFTIQNNGDFPVEIFSADFDNRCQLERQILRAALAQAPEGILLLPPREPGEALPSKALELATQRDLSEDGGENRSREQSVAVQNAHLVELYEKECAETEIVTSGTTTAVVAKAPSVRDADTGTATAAPATSHAGGADAEAEAEKEKGAGRADKKGASTIANHHDKNSAAPAPSKSTSKTPPPPLHTQSENDQDPLIVDGKNANALSGLWRVQRSGTPLLVVVVGPSLSGKTTQAQLLEKVLKLKSLDVNAAVHAEAEFDTPSGDWIRSFLSSQHAAREAAAAAAAATSSDNSEAPPSSPSPNIDLNVLLIACIHWLAVRSLPSSGSPAAVAEQFRKGLLNGFAAASPEVIAARAIDTAAVGAAKGEAKKGPTTVKSFKQPAGIAAGQAAAAAPGSEEGSKNVASAPSYIVPHLEVPAEAAGNAAFYHKPADFSISATRNALLDAAGSALQTLKDMVWCGTGVVIDDLKCDLTSDGEILMQLMRLLATVLGCRLVVVSLGLSGQNEEIRRVTAQYTEAMQAVEDTEIEPVSEEVYDAMTPEEREEHDIRVQLYYTNKRTFFSLEEKLAEITQKRSESPQPTLQETVNAQQEAVLKALSEVGSLSSSGRGGGKSSAAAQHSVGKSVSGPSKNTQSTAVPEGKKFEWSDVSNRTVWYTNLYKMLRNSTLHSCVHALVPGDADKNAVLDTILSTLPVRDIAADEKGSGNNASSSESPATDADTGDSANKPAAAAAPEQSEETKESNPTPVDPMAKFVTRVLADMEKRSAKRLRGDVEVGFVDFDDEDYLDRESDLADVDAQVQSTAVDLTDVMTVQMIARDEVLRRAAHFLVRNMSGATATMTTTATATATGASPLSSEKFQPHALSKVSDGTDSEKIGQPRRSLDKESKKSERQSVRDNFRILMPLLREQPVSKNPKGKQKASVSTKAINQPPVEELVETTRWTLAPHTSTTLMLELTGPQYCVDEFMLKFGVVGHSDELTLATSAQTSYPDINRNPLAVLPASAVNTKVLSGKWRKKQTRTKVWNAGKNQYEFGPLLVVQLAGDVAPVGFGGGGSPNQETMESSLGKNRRTSKQALDSARHGSQRVSASKKGDRQGDRSGSLNRSSVGRDASGSEGSSPFEGLPQEYGEVLTVTNTSTLPANISFSVGPAQTSASGPSPGSADHAALAAASIFSVHPQHLVLAPGSSGTVTVNAAPRTSGEKRATLTATIQGNPSPWTMDLSCIGVKPELTVNGNREAVTVNFGRCLMNQSMSQKLMIENDSLIPVGWSIGDLDKVPDDVFFTPQDGGLLLPHQSQELTITFSPLGMSLHNFQVRVLCMSVPQQSPPPPAQDAAVAKPGRSTSLSVSRNAATLSLARPESASMQLFGSVPLLVKAESHDVVMEWTRELDFKAVRVGDSRKDAIRILNKSPYEVGYQIRVPQLLRRALEFPIDGSLSGTLRGMFGYKDCAIATVDIDFGCDEEIEISERTVGEMEISFFNPTTKELVYPPQPIKVSGSVHYNHVAISPQLLNFGPCLFDQRKEATFEVYNTGLFDFTYQIFNYADGIPEMPTSGNTEQDSKTRRESNYRSGNASSKQEKAGEAVELAVGAFTVLPRFGMVPAGGVVVVTASICASANSTCHETLGIMISDGDPQMGASGMAFELLAEPCTPGIVADLSSNDNVNTLFEELQVVSCLEHHRNKTIPVYAREERTLSFGSVLVGRTVEERVRIANPNRVACTVTVKVISTGDSADGSPVFLLNCEEKLSAGQASGAGVGAAGVVSGTGSTPPQSHGTEKRKNASKGKATQSGANDDEAKGGTDFNSDLYGVPGASDAFANIGGTGTTTTTTTTSMTFTIPPFEKRYVAMRFTPSSLSTFRAAIEATVKGGTDSRTNYLLFHLLGDGVLPTVVLDLPEAVLPQLPVNHAFMSTCWGPTPWMSAAGLVSASGATSGGNTTTGAGSGGAESKPGSSRRLNNNSNSNKENASVSPQRATHGANLHVAALAGQFSIPPGSLAVNSTLVGDSRKGNRLIFPYVTVGDTSQQSFSVRNNGVLPATFSFEFIPTEIPVAEQRTATTTTTTTSSRKHNSSFGDSRSARSSANSLQSKQTESQNAASSAAVAASTAAADALLTANEETQEWFQFPREKEWVTLSAGESQQFDILFAPQAACVARRTLLLTVRDNSYENVKMDVFGEAYDESISLLGVDSDSNARISIGDCAVGEPKSRTVYIRNNTNHRMRFQWNFLLESGEVCVPMSEVLAAHRESVMAHATSNSKRAGSISQQVNNSTANSPSQAGSSSASHPLPPPNNSGGGGGGKSEGTQNPTSRASSGKTAREGGNAGHPAHDAVTPFIPLGGRSDSAGGSTASLPLRLMDITTVVASPSVGHLAPGATKAVTITVTSSVATRDVCVCRLVAQPVGLVGSGISDALGRGIKYTGDWDDSIQVPKWVPVDSHSAGADGAAAPVQARQSAADGGGEFYISNATGRRAMRKVLDVVPEPQVQVLDNEDTFVKNLCVSYSCDTAQYELSLPFEEQRTIPANALQFPTTMMFQRRRVVLRVANTGRVQLSYSMEVLTGLRETTRRESSCPFSLSADRGVVEPSSFADISITFSPVNVDEAQYILVAEFAGTDRAGSHVEIPLRGAGECPLVHFDVPASTYLESRRKADNDSAADMIIDPETVVLEFLARGYRSKTAVTFQALNPTNRAFAYTWRMRADAPSQFTPFRCLTPSGTIPPAAHGDMKFEFSPETFDVCESAWEFAVPGQKPIPFLLVGKAVEPRVYVDRSKVNFGSVLVGGRAEVVMRLVNEEETALPFTFNDEELRGSGMQVQPSKGTVAARAAQVVQLFFSPTTESQVNLTLACQLKRMSVPLTLNVKGEGFRMRDSMYLEVDRGVGAATTTVQIQACEIDGLNVDERKSPQTGRQPSPPPSGGRQQRLRGNQGDASSSAAAATEESGNRLDKADMLVSSLRSKIKQQSKTGGKVHVLNLGRVFINDQASRRFLLTNDGNLPLSFRWNVPADSVNIQISPDRGFVEPQSKVAVTLTYAPSVEESLVRELVECVVTNGGVYRIAVSAVSATPQLQLGFKSYDFGPRFITKYYRDREISATLSVTNVEKVPLMLDFSLPENCKAMTINKSGMVLAPRESEEVRVVFAPEMQEFYKTVLSIHVNGIAKIPVALSGEGVVPRVDMLTSVARFGAVRVGEQRSVVMTLQCSSKIPTPVSLENSITPLLDSMGFSLSPSRQILLKPGESRAVTVTLKPTRRVPDFSYDIQMEVCDSTVPFITLAGTCHGADVQLDCRQLNFDEVVAGSSAVRRVVIMNTGDYAQTYTWDDGMLRGYQVSVAPRTGTVRAHMEETCVFTFAPRAPDQHLSRQCDVRFEQAPTQTVNLTGHSSEVATKSEALHFRCAVRTTCSASVQVQNDSFEEWTVKPTVSNSQWRVPEKVVIKPHQSASLLVLFEPTHFVSPPASSAKDTLPPLPGRDQKSERSPMAASRQSRLSINKSKNVALPAITPQSRSRQSHMAQPRGGAKLSLSATMTGASGTPVESEGRMSKDDEQGNHEEGTLFIPLPSGQALSYKLIGKVDAPVPVRPPIKQRVEARETLRERLEVMNWGASAQRFTVRFEWDTLLQGQQAQSQGTGATTASAGGRPSSAAPSVSVSSASSEKPPAKGANAKRRQEKVPAATPAAAVNAVPQPTTPSADTIVANGSDSIYVPANAKKDYEFTFMSLTERKVRGTITFTNAQTGEYQYYIVDYDVVPAKTTTIATELTAAVRTSAVYNYTVANPLDAPVIVSARADGCPEVSVPTTTVVQPKQTASIPITFFPLMHKDYTPAKVTIAGAELGSAICQIALVTKPAAAEAPIRLSCPLGDTVTFPLRFIHYSKVNTEFTIKFSDKRSFARVTSTPTSSATGTTAAANTARGIAQQTLPAAVVTGGTATSIKVQGNSSSVHGSEVVMDILFEPTKIGTASAVIELTSTTAGTYSFPVQTTCVLPHPQGPFVVTKSQPLTVPFKNVLMDQMAFIYVAEPASVFNVSRAGETLASKKPANIQITLRPPEAPADGGAGKNANAPAQGGARTDSAQRQRTVATSRGLSLDPGDEPSGSQERHYHGKLTISAVSIPASAFESEAVMRENPGPVSWVYYLEGIQHGEDGTSSASAAKRKARR